MQDTGLEFRRLVSRCGWTQAIIASELGISQASVSGWAAKGVPASRALELSKLLDVPIEQVEPAIYRPKPSKPRPRSPYAMLAMEGDREAKMRLTSLISQSTLARDDINLLLNLTERLSLN